MRSLTSKEHWLRGELDGKWTRIAILPAGAKRLRLRAIFANAREAAEPRVELPTSPRRNRSSIRTGATWTIVEDLPEAAPSQVTIICERRPEYLISSTFSAPAGFSAASIFPRCLGPAREPLEQPAFNLDDALRQLEAGDVEACFVFAAKLCLAGRSDLLEPLVRRVVNYLAARPFERSDQFALLAAALSGVRSHA